MKKYLLLLITGLFSLLSFAHNPDNSTTMLVETENNTWVLQISASLTAFQQEVKTHFSETPYKTPEEFQQMVLDHIKNNLEIVFNDNQTISFDKGIVNLGHETKVIYEMIGVPSEIKSVSVKNSSFKDIHRNQSALVILKEGFNKEHFVLNNKNNHRLKLQVEGDKFVNTTHQNSYVSYILFGLLIAIVVFGVLCLLKRKNKTKNNS